MGYSYRDTKLLSIGTYMYQYIQVRYRSSLVRRFTTGTSRNLLTSVEEHAFPSVRFLLPSLYLLGEKGTRRTGFRLMERARACGLFPGYLPVPQQCRRVPLAGTLVGERHELS